MIQAQREAGMGDDFPLEQGGKRLGNARVSGTWQDGSWADD